MSYKNKISLKFSMVYFTIFLVIGINAPFWPLWLSSKGFDSRYISLIISLSVLMKIISNPFFAGLGDKYGNRKIPMLYLSIVASIILFTLSFINYQFLIGVLAIIAWAFFAPLMPITESLTTTAANKYGFDYGRTRLWGSVSFVLMAFLGGILVENYGLQIIPYIMSVGTFLVFISIYLTPTVYSLPSTHKIKITTLLRNRSFLPFLLACGAIQASHGMYYTFATIHWKNIGLSETMIGGLWAEGVLFEIVLLAYFYKIRSYFSFKSLLIFAALTATIRWIITAYATEPLILVFIQSLHSITFGLTHISAIYFISEVMPERAQAKSQALYSAISMGIIMSLAIAISGDLYDAYQEKAFIFSALLALSGAIITLYINKAN
ncbi:MAG: putative 3-phenylpropionic acid transporter [Alphaproteobacteria bacterium MarineAlpha9_Bin1]|nr:MAG: putative 3-phenylpropionic acid transporter [Alphaproteobacteria bacterium MarineAlpha9_Bin1]